VTPGITAPDVSLTRPAIMPVCAKARTGNRSKKAVADKLTWTTRLGTIAALLSRSIRDLRVI
jgi:hypothetical protein